MPLKQNSEVYELRSVQIATELIFSSAVCYLISLVAGVKQFCFPVNKHMGKNAQENVIVSVMVPFPYVYSDHTTVLIPACKSKIAATSVV